MNIKHFFTENQISVVLLGLLAGLFFPAVFAPLHPWNTLLLQLIFFLSALRINIRDVGEYLSDWKMNLLTTGFMLVFLPVAVYLPLSHVAPDWALAFLIALATPTGMTIALIADFFHGKTSLALIIVLTTSVLAPFTIPVVMKVLVGQNVPIDALGMLRSLAEAIIIPFVLSYLLQRTAPKFVRKGSKLWRTLSVVLFGLLIASIVSATAAKAADAAELNLSLHVFIILILTFFYLAFLIWLSYRMVSWRTVPERVTIALCMVYMNMTLALYIADTFFPEQNAVPKIVVIELLLNAMLPFFKVMAGYVVEHRGHVAIEK